MKRNKNIYVLYKTIRNGDGVIIDAENVGDFSTYEEIRKTLKCINRDIIKIVNENINNLENIRTYKNYFIIKE